MRYGFPRRLRVLALPDSLRYFTAPAVMPWMSFSENKT